MNHSKLEKTFAFVISAAAIVSFGVTAPVKADPVFPPAHVARDATFAAGTSAGAAPHAGPWYRPAPSDASRDTPYRGFEHAFNAAPETGPAVPWYRAAN